MPYFVRETRDVSGIYFSWARELSTSACQRQLYIFVGIYSEKFKQAVNEFDFSEYNTSVSTDIQYKGTIYKKGHFLVFKNDETMEFGELLIILIKNNAEVYLVMDVHKGDYHFEYHLYSVKKDVVR